jgi:hypothetical protein
MLSLMSTTNTPGGYGNTGMSSYKKQKAAGHCDQYRKWQKLGVLKSTVLGYVRRRRLTVKFNHAVYI